MTSVAELDGPVVAFATKCWCVLPGFYDFETEIEPIRRGIQAIITLLARKHGVDAPCDDPETAMTAGYRALIAENRAWGGEVYDAVKQIPGFMALVCAPRNAALFEWLRSGAMPGIAAGGYGIRIDNPSEERFRAQWHQEFPSQLRSLDGAVFWSPLLPVTPDMGPVEIAEGSQAEGLVPVFDDDGGVGKAGACALRMEREAERLAKYPIVAPRTRPGDLVLMDFLTLHQSGENRSDRPRWSMQWRLFNFRNPVGIDIGWVGSFASGKKIEDYLPELRMEA